MQKQLFGGRNFIYDTKPKIVDKIKNIYLENNTIYYYSEKCMFT